MLSRPWRFLLFSFLSSAVKKKTSRHEHKGPQFQKDLRGWNTDTNIKLPSFLHFGYRFRTVSLPISLCAYYSTSTYLANCKSVATFFWCECFPPSLFLCPFFSPSSFVLFFSFSLSFNKEEEEEEEKQFLLIRKEVSFLVASMAMSRTRREGENTVNTH